MPTQVTTEAATAAATERPTACLLHADIHVMRQECWGVTLEWNLEHQHLDLAERRDDYQAAVERKMLDNLMRVHQPDTAPQPTRPPAPGVVRGRVL